MSQIIIEASTRHTATIIFSHGLGDSAAGWAPFGAALKSKFKHIKWIFPTADVQRVTLNGGMPMNSWYDIKSLSQGNDDEAGMLKSVARLNGYIDKEVESGIPSERILVGGFSQGSVISLLLGVTSTRKIAGLAILSGYLGLSDKLDSLKTAHSTKLPIFWGHGKIDQTVRYQWGVQSKDKLIEHSFENIEFHSYPHMAHSLCEEEQDHLEAYFKRILPPI